MTQYSPTSREVRAFYDEFLHSRMLSYRVYGSKRIDAALRTILPLVRRDSVVLDIGCGIGIVSEQIARRARRGFVYGCDLSQDNIWYARRTVAAPNTDFFVCDVLTDLAAVETRIGRKLDVLVLIDVLEHFPAGSRSALFATLRRLCHDGTVLVLTYPSPAYQLHLRRSRPAELQPIDEVVATSDLVAVAEASGFHLRSFRRVDVFRKSQYVHCVFGVGETCEPLATSRASDMWAAGARLMREYITAPVRRYRYVTRVFGGNRQETNG